MLHCTLEYGSDVLQCTFACTGVLIHLLQSVSIPDNHYRAMLVFVQVRYMEYFVRSPVLMGLLSRYVCIALDIRSD